MLLPGGLVVYLGFEAGGFFPGPQDLVAVLLAALCAATIALDGLRILAGNRWLLAVTSCFAAYAAWVLISVLWSHAPLRATGEFDLTLLYLLTLLLFGCHVTSAQRIRWLLHGLAGGAFVVCLVGLVSRTLPAIWPVPSSLDTARLSYPVTYWNALGLLAAFGAILCIGLSGDDREPTARKALGAFAVPIFAATLLLTFSRGAIGAGLVGVIACVALSRSRSLPGALLSVVPTAAISLVVTYHATALAQPVAHNPAAAAEGHRVAAVVALCSLAAALARVRLTRLDRRLIALTWRRQISPRKLRARCAGGAAVVLLVALAAGLPHLVQRQYDEFVRGNAFPAYTQVRDRLTSTGADGRITVWRAALRQFDASPLHGTGAGTFQLAWDVRRPRYEQVVNAHSLYLENLGNLGIVGLGLLACVVIGSLVALARRTRGSDRALYATAFAVALTWAVRAGVDWDWQMPVVSLPVFALAGAALARPDGAGGDGRLARSLLSVGVLALGVLPALAGISQSHLQAALAAFEDNDCQAASADANASLSQLPFRADAHEILAFCEAAAGKNRAALRDMTRAVSDDPNNWETHYGLAIVEAASGGDPRAQIARARALDPKNQLTIVGSEFFGYAFRRSWPQEAALDVLQVAGQGDRNLSELRPRS